ncbi:aminotransferase class I/II-fold pyridoxal phosphate-dependent enzyme [Cellulophaga sp. F20128]|uniref:pyridoxal phosphate-dependent aminotransferase n=1 Tax=Cellulophaga sp. F20128 TaxID=2926413 RepID=UPI001FF64878|nr:aminotransferase class I/II-fold pyridoxal phosphate-dependent enzyme [Cellulophaga sp. F20128]MCK0156047.1 aminotransferase class I/II-fold pyridoxal phosphate-dependent enzyme [Cellulophaga sp. F20128]
MKTADRLAHIQEYYFSKKLREVRGLMAEGRPVINMGIGSPDLEPSASVVAAIKNAVDDAGAHQYQSYQGLPELRAGIANFYKTNFQVSVNPEDEILPLMGSKEGILHISMAFLNEGDEALIPNPGYPTYTSVTNLVGAVPKYYDLVGENQWFPDLEALGKQDLSKVKIMWVCYPHMPTGATATTTQLAALVQFAKRNNILLVNDNPYSFVLNDEPKSILSIEGAKECTLELNSLSKTFNMAGWRVGMVLGSSDHITAVLKVKSNMDSGMFYGIQKGAIAALQSSKQWFQDLNKVYTARRELIFQLADKLNCSYDKNAVGMFVWAKLPEDSVSSEKFIDAILYDKNIFLTPGTIFGSNGEGYIRFSLCVTEEKIKEAIKRLG